VLFFEKQFSHNRIYIVKIHLSNFHVGFRKKIFSSVNPRATLILYADDSAIFYAHKDPGIIEQKLSRNLGNCFTWLVDNRLSLHLGKTETISFGPPRKLKQVVNFTDVCNGQEIKGSDSVKYLGVCIDKSLSFENIALSIIHKVNARLRFLYRNVCCLNMMT
jgi:hypothetical protein